jgi:hypothetical protein
MLSTVEQCNFQNIILIKQAKIYSKLFSEVQTRCRSQPKQQKKLFVTMQTKRNYDGLGKWKEKKQQKTMMPSAFRSTCLIILFRE